MDQAIRKFIIYCTTSEADAIGDLEEIMSSSAFKEVMAYCQTNKEAAKVLAEEICCYLPKMPVLKAGASAGLAVAYLEQIGVCEQMEAIIFTLKNVLQGAFEYIIMLATTNNIPFEQIEGPDTFAQAESAQVITDYSQQYQCYLALSPITLASVSAVTLNLSLRAQLADEETDALLTFLNAFEPNLTYLLRSFDLCDQLEVLMISPKYQKGYQVKAHALENAFHFFTLWQECLKEKGLLTAFGVKDYTSDRTAIKIAKGYAYAQTQTDLTACLQYYTYKALDGDLTYQVILTDETGKREVDPESLIWGEMPLSVIPELDGQVIIFFDDDLLFTRGWGIDSVQKFHSNLKPSVTIEAELTEQAVQEWIQKALEANQA